MRKKRKKNKKSFSFTIIAIFIIFLVVSMGYVRIKIEQTKVGYEISKNKKIERILLKERQLAKANLMELKSLNNLELFAKKMGFKFPTQEDVIFVDKTTVVGKRR